jgi:hypothetical protein
MYNSQHSTGIAVYTDILKVAFSSELNSELSHQISPLSEKCSLLLDLASQRLSKKTTNPLHKVMTATQDFKMTYCFSVSQLQGQSPGTRACIFLTSKVALFASNFWVPSGTVPPGSLYLYHAFMVVGSPAPGTEASMSRIHDYGFSRSTAQAR